MRPRPLTTLASGLVLAALPALAQTTAPAPAPDTTGGLANWWWIILLIVLIAAAVWYFMRGRTRV